MSQSPFTMATQSSALSLSTEPVLQPSPTIRSQPKPTKSKRIFLEPERATRRATPTQSLK